MRQGMLHDYYMNPGGGNPLYDDPLQGWGMMGMDLGLAFFGRSAVGMLGKAHGNYLKGTIGNIPERTLRAKGFKGAFESYQRGGGAKGKSQFYKQDYSRVSTKSLARKHAAGVGGQIAKSKASYATWGKQVKYLGLATAAIGLLDLGFSLFYEMASPGVSRETLEQDRQNIANDEGMLDTRMAYTQRQRAMQAVHDSQLSIGRAMIGQEASHLHR